MRVYELAKEVGLDNKIVLERLQELGVEVSSNFNAVPEEDIERLKASFAGGTGKAKKATKKAAPKKTTKKKTTKASAPKKAAPKKAAPKKAAPKKAAPKKAAPKKAAPKKAAPKKATKVAAETPAAEQAARTLVSETEPAKQEKPQEKVETGPAAELSAAAETTARGPVKVEEGISLRVLAERAGVPPADILRKLMARGVMANLNQPLEARTAVEILGELGIETEKPSADEILLGARDAGKPEDLEPRAPVVTIMGHVDHGKTLLLDSIRKTNVVDREAGGITQHIGASEVLWKGNRVVFIDTPGHEAFTRMRARGAQVTDIVVLVVAADDGVMPQTIEAIDHARAAEVPIVVAVNKIDRPNANPDRALQQLAERNLTPEEWGGDTVCVRVSAKTGENLEDLLEMISLTSELLELQANPSIAARGIVLEAELDRQRGPVATLLVQEGTLRVGDSLVAGVESAKVRAMISANGEPVKEVGPATAVEILGFDGVPGAGDSFQEIDESAAARKVAEIRQNRKRQDSMSAGTRLTLEDLHARLRAGQTTKLPVVLKADVRGSVEVLKDSLAKLPSDKVEIEILHAGVGGINERDVLLASASDAIIVGFGVRPERDVADQASQAKVDLRLYTIIYELIDDVRAAMQGKLSPTFEESDLGAAEVRDTFRVPRTGTVAGCYITNGKIVRNAKVRLVRDSRVVFEGNIGSLRRFKEDVREVQQGYECGIGIANFNDVKVGDVIEAFEVEEIRPTL